MGFQCDDTGMITSVGSGASGLHAAHDILRGLHGRAICTGARPMMRKLPLVVAACALAHATPAHATEAGIDVGWVVANGVVVDATPVVDPLGVGWVRINFRLDAWTSPTEPGWFEAYDQVVDAFVARGYQIYGLLNDEAVATSAPHGSATWIADFVANAVAIVDHFKDRVRVYEVINEPNDFAGGSSSRFTTAQYARILQDTYLAVKHDAGHIADRCWQVQLVSGALFSFDGVAAADYLADAYAIGRNQLAWDYTHEVTGSYPLDGIGYHMYVAQGSDSSLDDVATAMQQNLGAVWDVVTANEGAATPKQLWVSEYGFRANLVGDAGQADRLATGIDTMRDFGHVALGIYFNLQDFPDNAWGVYDDAGQPRPSAARLAEVAAANRPPLGALVSAVAGDSEAIVTIENRGSEPWGDDVRLGAASGCPDASATNELAWVPSAGYANGVTDARAFLPGGVAPGERVELRVPVQAAAGSYTFAARMVKEGAAWFGQTATVRIDVTGDGDAGDDDANEPGGCASTRGAEPWFVLLALGYCSRRWRRRPIAR